ncbi:MAG: cytochrome c [Chloroflexi bacterium]|nr:cytochrome c [Chloroflexota bacterium]
MLLFVGITMLLTACFPRTGAYPVDLFIEMHYQQSYRSQEPPRLKPAEGAVPVAGRETVYAGVEAARYKDIANPVPRTEANLAQGAEIFRVNCSLCHGLQGKGDGGVAQFLLQSATLQAGGIPPANLTGPITTGRTDGEIFEITTNGRFVPRTGGYSMPTFKNLLTAEKRWLLVHYLRKLQGR